METTFLCEYLVHAIKHWISISNLTEGMTLCFGFALFSKILLPFENDGQRK